MAAVAHQDGGALGHPQVGLPQDNAFPLSERDRLWDAELSIAVSYSYACKSWEPIPDGYPVGLSTGAGIATGTAADLRRVGSGATQAGAWAVP